MAGSSKIWVFTLLLTCSNFVICAIGNAADGKKLEKRSIQDMARMVRETTGQNALAFNDYGNYCGLGGEGPPLDGIDHCCFLHDRCYEHLNEHGCMPYLSNYNYYQQGRYINCMYTGDWCRDVTCMCDRDLAQCIPWYPYNPKLKHMPYLGTVLKTVFNGLKKKFFHQGFGYGRR